MKRIEYLFNIPINNGTKENPVMEDCLFPKSLPYSQVAEEIAKREAYNGEYEITPDDGQPEVYQPTTEERLAALEAAQLEMLGVIVDG